MQASKRGGSGGGGRERRERTYLLLRHLLRQLLSLQLLQLPLAPHLALAVPLDCALLIRLQVLALVALQLLILRQQGIHMRTSVRGLLLCQEQCARL